MSYTGQNPRFRSTILTDVGVSSISNPPSGSHRIINRSGTLQVQDSAGVETPIGSGGTVDRISQTGHGFVVGEMLYYTGSAYAKARADVVSTAEIVGMVSRVINANEFEVTLEGKVTGLSGLTAGTTYFLSASTAGAITATEPSTLGYVSLPVGVAISTTVIYVRTSRGAVVGSVNARTEITLFNNTTTNVQDVSAYSAGELSGWIEIDGTTDYRFFVSAPFAKNGANSDYYISPVYVGDTPPVGFDVIITSGGTIRVTLPNVTGFVSSKINYALNVPAVGATFPLSIDSTLVQFSTLKAKDSSGFVFQENGGTQIGSWSDTGVLTVGPTNFTGLHQINSGANFNFVNNPSTSQTTIAGYNNSIIQFTANTTTTDRTGIFGTVSGIPVGIGFERVNGGTWQTDISFMGHLSPTTNQTTLTEIGRGTGNGAWTFGVPGGTETQRLNGVLHVKGTNTSAPQIGVPLLGATSYAGVTITNGSGAQTITTGGIYSGGLILVRGSDNAGNRWIDLLYCGDSSTWSGGITVLSSKTLNSPPSTRTYTFSGSSIQINPSGGTAGNYDVGVGNIFT